MLFGKCKFFCSFEGDTILPPCKSATFPGRYGHLLKQPGCSNCLLTQRFISPAIFDTSALRSSPEGSRTRDFPLPF